MVKIGYNMVNSANAYKFSRISVKIILEINSTKNLFSSKFKYSLSKAKNSFVTEPELIIPTSQQK